MAFSTSCAPAMINGMLSARPKSRSTRLPFAAAATPSTLSMLITRSATITVHTAASRRSFAFTSTPPSSAGSIRRMPIHTSAMPPAIFSHGSVRSPTANTVSTTRRTIAPSAPQISPQRFCFGGRLRQASAITTALSPDNRMLMTMISTAASQNCGVAKSMPRTAARRSVRVAPAQRVDQLVRDPTEVTIDLEGGSHESGASPVPLRIVAAHCFAARLERVAAIELKRLTFAIVLAFAQSREGLHGRGRQIGEHLGEVRAPAHVPHRLVQALAESAHQIRSDQCTVRGADRVARARVGHRIGVCLDVVHFEGVIDRHAHPHLVYRLARRPHARKQVAIAILGVDQVPFDVDEAIVALIAFVGNVARVQPLAGMDRVREGHRVHFTCTAPGRRWQNDRIRERRTIRARVAYADACAGALRVDVPGGTNDEAHYP